MDTLMQANIFFFVTTVSVVLLAAAAVSVIIYVALIAWDIRQITKRIKKESNSLFENVKEVREVLFADKRRIFDLLSFFGGIIQKVVEVKTEGAVKKKSTSARKKRSTRRASTPKEE